MLVAANKQLYVTLPKRQKMLLSRSIVNAVRSQNPPGRFLQKEAKSDLWYDVGDQRAQEKTSQALREGAPDIRLKVTPGDGTDDSTHPSTATKSETLNSTKPSISPPPQPSLPNPAILTPGIPFVPAIIPAGVSPPPGSTPVVIYAMPQNGMPGVPMYQAMMTPQGVMVPNSIAPAFPPPVPPQGPTKTKAGNNDPAPAPSDLMPPPPNQVPSQPNPYNLDFQQAMTEHASVSTTHDHAYAPVTHKSDEFDDFEREAAALMNSALEPSGMSFGTASIMSVGNAKLETAGLSFGSMMSYTVANSRAPDMVDGGLEPIGTSFGSLSLNSVERNNLQAALYTSEPRVPASMSFATPTLLSQQRSKGNLLECSDTESDDEDDETPPNQPSKSAEWEKLKDMLEKHANIQQDHAAYAPHAPQPVQYSQYEAVPQTALYDNLSALSMGDFGDDDDFANISPVQLRKGYDGEAGVIPLHPQMQRKHDDDDGCVNTREREQLDMMYLAQNGGANCTREHDYSRESSHHNR